MGCLKLIIQISIIFILLSGCSYKKARTKRFKQQIDTFYLDLHLTNMYGWEKDKEKLKKFIIVFKRDSTFYTNMKSPFLPDTFGWWKTGHGGWESWNYLYFYRNNLTKDTLINSKHFGDICDNQCFELINEKRNNIEGSQYIYLCKTNSKEPDTIPKKLLNIVNDFASKHTDSSK